MSDYKVISRAFVIDDNESLNKFNEFIKEKDIVDIKQIAESHVSGGFQYHPVVAVMWKANEWGK